MTSSLSCACVSSLPSKCVFLSANKTQHHMNVLHTVTRKHTILHVYLIGVSNSEIKKKEKKIKATVILHTNPTIDYISLELHVII